MRIQGTPLYTSWKYSTQVRNQFVAHAKAADLLFSVDMYQDISLSTVSANPGFCTFLRVLLTSPLKWLALTPPDLVKAHLGFDDATMARLFKSQQILIAPST